MQEVTFNIKGTQEIDGNSDVMEFVSVGKYTNSEDAVVLEYDEGISFGISGVKTTLTLHKDDGIVTLERSGGKYGNLVVEEGKRHLCQYSTEYGDIMIGIFGECIRNDLTETGGKLSLQYSIDVNAGLLSRNKVEISIREEA